MRKQICIILPIDYIIDSETKIDNIKVNKFFKFNNCSLLAATFSLDHFAILIYIFHSEFISVKEGQLVPYYSYEEARKKFPYLFVNTNPLLYRKY